MPGALALALKGLNVNVALQRASDNGMCFYPITLQDSDVR